MRFPISALGLLVVALASSAVAAEEPVADLGRVLWVGDSITHGKSSGSWRWELFKIFVDNDIRLQEVGVQSGNYNGRGGIAPGTRYRGVTFANRHAAQFSEKAAEVAGRLVEPSRMGGTNIRHWLRLDGKPDGRWQLAEGEIPDTFFLAIGTNDFVAEHSGEPGGLAAAQKKVQAALIGKKRGKGWNGKGDMDAIVAAMREANASARIIAVGIPTYSDAVGKWCHKAITPADYAAVAAYNRALRQWGRARGITVVEMNEGFRDVSKEGAAVGDMLVDQMHPNAQGNLIYAGNVAQQLGYAGRTAGLERKAASAFPRQEAACRVKRGSNLSLSGSGAGQGATLEFRLARQGVAFGEASPLVVKLSTAMTSGELAIHKNGISWSGRTLYSAEMNQLTEPVRMAYVPGDVGSNISGGFYIWLGDMLIGEALSGTPHGGTEGTEAEVRVPGSMSAVRFDFICLEPAHAWAPPSSRFYSTHHSHTSS